MIGWRDYMAGKDPAQHTVTGRLLVAEQVYSPQLKNRRDILVHLPPSYDHTDRRYPVIYMHDGQNCFDHATSYVGEWQVDETLTKLSAEGLEAIAVGIPSLAEARPHELSPFEKAPMTKGLGDAYLEFIVETVRPLVAAEFRVSHEARHTGILGSSLGGLIGLYGYMVLPDVFGLAAVFSPAFWLAMDRISRVVEERSRPLGRIYMDVGTAEGTNIEQDPGRARQISQSYLDGCRHMRDLLLARGYEQGRSLMYVEDEGAVHHESAWARRLPDALRFLLS